MSGLTRSTRYYEMVPQIEKYLEQQGEIRSSRQIQDALGMGGTMQATLAAVLNLADQDENSVIKSAGWRQLDSGHGRLIWQKVWGLNGWKFEVGPEPAHMQQRRESRAATERRKKRAKAKERREAAERAAQPSPSNNGTKRGHKETKPEFVATLGSTLQVVGIELDGDKLIWTVLDEQQSRIRLVEAGD